MGLRVFAAMLIAAMIGQSAFARENFVLQVNDQEFNGSGTLRLRAMLQEQYGINSAGLDLVGVRLVAKSKFGRGGAALTVGNWNSLERIVAGSPLQWNNPSPQTYDRIDFENQSWRENGAWQIQLRGNIKVRRVVLVVEDRRGDHDQDQDQDFGGRPRPIRYQDVACFSNNNALAQCPVNGQIISVQVLQQHSIAPCIEGRTYGVANGAIWVRGGCRANFQVGVRGH